MLGLSKEAHWLNIHVWLMMSKEGIMELKQVQEGLNEPVYLIPKKEFYIKMKNYDNKRE